MNVEAYRRTIRRRMRVMSILGVAYGAAMIAVHTFWARESMTYAGDFLVGIASGLIVCAALILPRYAKALRDEKALLRLWNQEHDERLRAIKARAGAPMILYTSAAMIAVGLLICPWSATACLTLIAAASAQLVASAAVKLICMRTM